MIKGFIKIISVLIGVMSSLTACSSKYKKPVKEYMKTYLKEKTGKDFEEVQFYNAMNEGSSATNKYYGLWRSIDDKRIELSMMAKIDFDTEKITPVNPEAIDERIEIAVRCAELSNQIDKLSRKYVTPVFVQVKGSGEFYKIRISVEDHINNELSDKYFLIVKDIVKEIKSKVLQEPIYFVVDFYIFGGKFPFKKVIYSHGVFGTDPIGDYHISVVPTEGYPLISNMGMTSRLDNELQNKVFEEAEDKFDGLITKDDVLYDLPPHKVLFPEDINEKGIREYTRYFVAIWDNDRKNVIDRKFARVNIFTKAIEWYEVKEFPRPIKK